MLEKILSFLPSHSPTELEKLVISFVAERLPAEQRERVLQHFALVKKFQRIDKKREVCMYPGKKKGVRYFPEELKFQMSPGQTEHTLATLRIQDRETGHGTKATVTVVSGRLFQIEFSLPPGDIEAKNAEISGEVYPLNLPA